MFVLMGVVSVLRFVIGVCEVLEDAENTEVVLLVSLLFIVCEGVCVRACCTSLMVYLPLLGLKVNVFFRGAGLLVMFLLGVVDEAAASCGVGAVVVWGVGTEGSGVLGVVI